MDDVANHYRAQHRRAWHGEDYLSPRQERPHLLHVFVFELTDRISERRDIAIN